MFAIGLEIGIILMLLMINSILAMSGMAVVSSRKVRLQQRADAGDAGAGQRSMSPANRVASSPPYRSASRWSASLPVPSVVRRSRRCWPQGSTVLLSLNHRARRSLSLPVPSPGPPPVDTSISRLPLRREHRMAAVHRQSRFTSAAVLVPEGQSEAVVLVFELAERTGTPQESQPAGRLVRPVPAESSR